MRCLMYAQTAHGANGRPQAFFIEGRRPSSKHAFLQHHVERHQQHQETIASFRFKASVHSTTTYSMDRKKTSNSFSRGTEKNNNSRNQFSSFQFSPAEAAGVALGSQCTSSLRFQPRHNPRIPAKHRSAPYNREYKAPKV